MRCGNARHPSEKRSDNGAAGPKGEPRSGESSWDPVFDFDA
jgi:hypothetical protein